MRSYFRRSMLCLILALLSFAAVSNRGMCSRVKAEDTAGDDGFVALFNGKNLDGWQTSGKWVVEKDGSLRLIPRPRGLGLFRHRNYLWTKKPYGDFVLDLEFKIEKGGNSGVFFRASSSRSYLEAQIYDSAARTKSLRHTDAGGLVDIVAPSKNASKPAGQWNRMVVTCKGKKVQVKLNGQEVVDIDLAKKSRGAVSATGNIGLQDNGDRVWFRNIRIKQLN